MTLEQINAINLEVEKVYNIINNTASNCGLELNDLAFPEHDGVEDDVAIGDMMTLWVNLNGLRHACKIMAEKITYAIGDYEE